MENQKQQIVYLPIDDVKPYENNPRYNEKAIADVATSIRKYGWKQPLVVDKDNVIVVGHTRYEAAKSLGLTEVPAIVSELSDEENREYRIVDNKTNEAATWDFAKLDIETVELDFSDFEFDLHVFNDKSDIQDIDEQADMNDENKRKQVTLSDDTYQLIIDCENEQDMQNKFEKLKEVGIECRISTL